MKMKFATKGLHFQESLKMLKSEICKMIERAVEKKLSFLESIENDPQLLEFHYCDESWLFDWT